MNVKHKVLWLALVCMGCLMLGITHAADATKKMTLDDCKAVLEKLKTDMTITKYKLSAGENGMLKLDLSYSSITDLTPLKGMPLEWLHIDGSDHDPSKVVTLAGLEGMPLKELSLMGNVALEDIRAIKGAPLKVFKIMGTHGGNPTVEDLDPLAGMALEEVVLGLAAKDVNVLKGMPLKSVQLSGPVTNISGLKGLQLKTISLHGANKLVDLSPLQGMPLESIDLFGVIATDLSPLSGMPLKHLEVPQRVRDLSPLKDLPALESLNLGGSKVTDLAPLKAVKKLKTLSLTDWRGSSVTDISPLAECKNLTSVKVPATCKDLEPLRKVESLEQINGQPVADFWKKYDEAKNKK